MKQRPIIFNTEMVRAILDGRKTQTRRPMEPQPHQHWHPFSAKAEWYTPTVIDKKGFYQPAKNQVFGVSDEDQGFVSPFVAVGDQLWVRETFADCGSRLTYKADKDDGAHCVVKRWTPSIHMPRYCARILLEVTAVRVERLNDISKQDAKAEGFDYPAVPGMGWKLNAKQNFLFSWDKIYGNRSLNPFVWVIEFKVISTTGGAA
ncbi:hypothetical protein [Shewanella glacialipiscicola]|uniref:hypothetical protein n=1 Tax=Shewanella glacialipiscicola TaxID=614069 RepID=UPI003D7AAE39